MNTIKILIVLSLLSFNIPTTHAVDITKTLKAIIHTLFNGNDDSDLHFDISTEVDDDDNQGQRRRRRRPPTTPEHYYGESSPFAPEEFDLCEAGSGDELSSSDSESDDDSDDNSVCSTTQEARATTPQNYH